MFTIGATALLGGEGVIAPIAIGFALMVMVYAGGHISGVHYNPAVSLAAVVRGALEPIQWIPYAIAQVAGGAIAALTVYMLPEIHFALPVEDWNLVSLCIGEFLFTFALCYVVLLTATATKAQNNSYFGLAIGATVTVGAFAVGSICLGAFNPAVAISTLILHTVCCAKIAWITVAINLVAGACAGLVYKLVNNN